MNIEDIKKSSERKSIICSVRITPKQFKFMKENDISLTLLVSNTFKELMKFD